MVSKMSTLTEEQLEAIKESGPYRAASNADGTILIIPAWPQFSKYNPEEGGGPGLFSRIALAKDIEELLNAVNARSCDNHER